MEMLSSHTREINWRWYQKRVRCKTVVMYEFTTALTFYNMQTWFNGLERRRSATGIHDIHCRQRTSTQQQDFDVAATWHRLDTV
jgi:hypothetical protein